jgi:two-component system phosphate regulon sensor histidine kinase PhoR
MSTTAHKILVVDDELGMREGCRKILVSEGYEVETAGDGQAGLDLFHRDRDFDAALIDLKMPRMGGLELVEAIRREDQDIVLLVITAYASIQTAVEAVKRGAYGYIPKPFTPDELLLPVRNGLEKRALSLEAARLRQERERRLLEVAYERSKGRTIINCMTDAVLVINQQRQIVLQNAAVSRTLPAAATRELPAPMDRLGCPALEELLEESLGAEPGPVICTREIKIGESTYMVNASPVFEPNQETFGAVAVLRDITDLKKLSEAKSMFVSMVSHEIKAPLAAIEGYLKIIQSGLVGDDPGKSSDMVGRCLVRAEALREMVSELMNIVAMEKGQFTIKRVPMEIEGIVVQVVESFKERAKTHNIEIRLKVPEPPARKTVLVDGGAMHSVFSNLIDNAVKYTPEGGHVDVRVGYDRFRVKVAVRDDGIGMTAEEADRIFDEFYRARNEKTSEIIGTGLGLCVVKRLVELHQGEVTVETSPGQGSEFCVILELNE